LLAVLLAGLLAMKTLSIADGAAGLFAERAMAASPEPEPEPISEPVSELGTSGGGEAEPDPQDAQAGSDATAAPDRPTMAPRSRIPTQSELLLETDLAQRRRELVRRAEALDTREELLAVAQGRYDQRLVELHSLRDEIQGLLGELDARRETEVDAIVNTYGQLEPDAAAGILQAMQDTDPDTLLTVASALQSASARRFAAVMAEMDPAFAASLTSRLRARAAPEPSPVELEARNAAAGEG
jgi:flagellar motility protein MotE (MotC chaperone)